MAQYSSMQVSRPRPGRSQMIRTRTYDLRFDTVLAYLSPMADGSGVAATFFGEGREAGWSFCIIRSRRHRTMQGIRLRIFHTMKRADVVNHKKQGVAEGVPSCLVSI